MVVHGVSPKIQQEVSREPSNGKPSKGPARPFKLTPKRGTFHTYRLIRPDSIHKGDPGLWIDLGFKVTRETPIHKTGFKAGMLIESEHKGKYYAMRATKRKETDLYTYNAFVQRVVDGDTILVDISLGFGIRIREYLRLRGIDAPEMDTADGKKAREFIARELEKVDHVILSSTRSDKYGRYLADVFYGIKDEQYLNQRLLDEELAVPFS